MATESFLGHQRHDINDYIDAVPGANVASYDREQAVSPEAQDLLNQLEMFNTTVRTWDRAEAAARAENIGQLRGLVRGFFVLSQKRRDLIRNPSEETYHSGNLPSGYGHGAPSSAKADPYSGVHGADIFSRDGSYFDDRSQHRQADGPFVDATQTDEWIDHQMGITTVTAIDRPTVDADQ